MPRDNSGTFVPSTSSAYPAQVDTLIDPNDHNSLITDIAAGITDSALLDLSNVESSAVVESLSTSLNPAASPGMVLGAVGDGIGFVAAPLIESFSTFGPAYIIPNGASALRTASFAPNAGRGGGDYSTHSFAETLPSRGQGYWWQLCANGWVILCSPTPDVTMVGAVPDAHQVGVDGNGNPVYGGTDSSVAFQQAAYYVIDNRAYLAPGVGSGMKNVGRMRSPAGAFLITESQDWTLDGTYPSGDGMELYGDGIQSVIYVQMTEAYPAFDFTGNRKAYLGVTGGLYIRVASSSLSTCGAYWGQPYTTNAQQNDGRCGATIVIDGVTVPPNWVDAVVVQNTDAFSLVGTGLLNGIHLGVASPILHLTPVLAATATTVTLDAEATTDPKTIGKPIIIVNAGINATSGNGYGKVRTLKQLSTSVPGTFDVDPPWNVDPTGQGTTNGFHEDNSIPGPMCFAEVASVASKFRVVPGIQSNQTYYKLGEFQLIGPVGLTLRAVEQVELHGLATGGYGLTADKCAVLFKDYYARFWGLQTAQLMGNFYTENQANYAENGFTAIASYTPQMQIDHGGLLNVQPPTGRSTSTGALISTKSKAKAWALSTNTGTGTITLDTVPVSTANTIQNGDFHITMTSPTAFSIVDTFGNTPVPGTGVVGTLYDGQIRFTIGGTWDTGDKFTVVANQGQIEKVRLNTVTQDSTVPLFNIVGQVQSVEGTIRAPGGLGIVGQILRPLLQPIVRFGDLTSAAAWAAQLKAATAAPAAKAVQRYKVSPTHPAYTGGGVQQTSFSYALPAPILALDNSGEAEIEVSATSYTAAGCTYRPYLRQGTAIGSPPAWAASTAYTIGTIVTNGGSQQYYCYIAGTSAASGGPSGSGSTTDGTAKWWAYPFIAALTAALTLAADDRPVLSFLMQNNLNLVTTGYSMEGTVENKGSLLAGFEFGQSNFPPFDPTLPISLDFDTVTGGATSPLQDQQFSLYGS